MLKTAKKLQRDWFLSHEGAQRPLVARRNHFEARLIIFGYKVEPEDVGTNTLENLQLLLK